ncbi:MAG: peptide-methionine (S)-S-oxide reductase MsrA [Candidatus Loosdrechtia sp.]|uniref:peptide-methionine (S)-S-oxide reductase n=1 Tax=Candidatus Loosdrechtia sp. TaxID=3101272 RepID=UPI003A75203B|nr:MAG: peptide-methionine (S)-S-oxide reductase MsrA [Candidatus Jettenia sp. AMX2]
MIIQVFLGLFLGSLVLPVIQSCPATTVQQNRQNVTPSLDKEVITLGGGCFWCLETIFEELEGIEQVESGYSGGHVDKPTYQQVCSGTTGHAEVVQITFDPKVMPLKEILRVFFTMHDPTTPNRQGADTGTQYRSVIFYRNQEQKDIAEQVICEIQTAKLWDAPVITEIAPFQAFYKAEDYHQDYYRKNTNQSYCRFVIAPKIKKFRELYQDKIKRK